jgi:FAD/FMN-containing dehydrogenase
MHLLLPALLALSLAALAAHLATRRPAGPPRVRARPRRLPWVHSTLRVTRDAWRNWSGELRCVPRRLYCDEARGPWRSPRTLEDLQAIVRDARAEGAKVRVFGSSHSWSRLAPADDGFMVDNRMIGAEGDHYRLRLDPADGGRGPRATAPPGLTSREFEAWLWAMGYSLPTSAVEDCFTLGGMAATATHGAGFGVATVSDLVAGMTFVDGLGEVRRWSRETATADELAAIQCGLGCLGLVYDVTFDVVPRVEVLHVARSVPYGSLFADTDAARAALRDLHEGYDSIEFFWWPFRYAGLPFVSRPEINPDVWVLAMKRDAAASAVPRGALRRFWHLQVLDIASMVVCGLLASVVLRSPRAAFLLAWMTCSTNLWVDARSGAFRMSLADGNHFVNATGVEFVRAVACEWSVPFDRRAPLDRADGYERVRQSFAVSHDLVVEAFHAHAITDPRASPIVLAVEMRTLGASSALLSPGYQPDDRRGAVSYAAPELVTSAGHPAWPEFARRVNLAMTTRPEVFGDAVGCHLAKPFHDMDHPEFPVGGMRAYTRAQHVAAGTWERFLAVRRDVDPDGVFLNDHLRAWFDAPASERTERAAA